MPFPQKESTVCLNILIYHANGIYFCRMAPRMFLLFLFCLLTAFVSISQQLRTREKGIITGNLLDEKKSPVIGASVELIVLTDSLLVKGTLSAKDGGFSFTDISFGRYRLRISSVGFKTIIIDSLFLRSERFDFSLNDMVLHSSANSMQEVIVYAEKPLIQSREGNITYNASESPLSAGSNASDLLKNVPLVSADPNGKLTVRGKDPKILIDDKPVELNAQQLQDFLESMPGSMIERIEVMTNPPPQYANEPGGVINIVTRKGKVGKTGRVSFYAGTRGEAGVNGNFTYRKKGLSININAGMGYNLFEGNGYSKRQNIYVDSINFLNTENNYRNKNTRPNARISMDYDLNERNAFNVVWQFNQNDFDNLGNTQYSNLDRREKIYLLSKRRVSSEGNNRNPSLSITYTHKGRKPGETLRLYGNTYYSFNRNNRFFYQQFYFPDFTPNGIDSIQQQFTNSRNNGYSFRLAYDKLFDNKRTSVAAGAFYNFSSNRVELLSVYLKKPENIYLKSDLLSNDFRFRQRINNFRFSVKQVIAKGMSVSGGLSAEQTGIHFDLFELKQETNNDYWTLLPFANFNKQWEDVLNLTISYRRSIRRPGMGELNPSIDYGDPYNLRFGNTSLRPTTSHNFDLLLGRNRDKYYLNIGLGYNIVQDIFTQIRILQPDGKTFVSWQNIDDRLEYEISSWNGYNFSKNLRLNFSASYTYNRYSLFDRSTYKYRDGGSFTSSLNTNYTPKEVWNLNGSFTFNRFANPQGYVRWNTSMNLGLQRKFLQKRFIVTLNIIDPIKQQENKTFTYGPDFIHESYSYTQTRNYRLTLTYNFIPVSKTTARDQLEKEKLKRILPKK